MFVTLGQTPTTFGERGVARIQVVQAVVGVTQDGLYRGADVSLRVIPSVVGDQPILIASAAEASVVGVIPPAKLYDDGYDSTRRWEQFTEGNKLDVWLDPGTSLLPGVVARELTFAAVAMRINNHGEDPGDFVGLLPGCEGRVSRYQHPEIGVVDPFYRSRRDEVGVSLVWVLIPHSDIPPPKPGEWWTHPVLDAPPSPPRKSPPVTKPEPWQTVELKRLGEKAISTKSTAVFNEFVQLAIANGYPDTDCKLITLATTLEPDWWRCEFEILRVAEGEVAAARLSIKQLAESIVQSEDSLLASADLWVKEQDYTYDNSESYKGIPEDRWIIFWEAYRVLNGLSVDWKPPTAYPDSEYVPTFFTCSC